MSNELEPMEPKEFDEEDLDDLPPHRIFVLAKDQHEYKPLPVVLLEGEEHRYISRWTFTDEERKRIAAGEDLYIEQLTFGQLFNPVLPTVGIRDFCPMD